MNEPNAITVAERGQDAQILQQIEREISQVQQWIDCSKRRLSALTWQREELLRRMQGQ